MAEEAGGATKTLGQLLKKLRSGKGLTQEQLAAELNVSRSTLANWERDGERPGPESRQAILDFFPEHREELGRFLGLSDSSEPGGGGRIWLMAAPVLLLLLVAAVALLVLADGDDENDSALTDCTTPHPIAEVAGLAVDFTDPTDPIPRILMEDGMVAGTFSGELESEQFWLLLYALDVARYWVSEQPMALDYNTRTWRSIGGSIQIGNEEPDQIGRRFELVLVLVEPDAIAQIPSSLEMGGWAVDQVPDGITMLSCASVFRA